MRRALLAIVALAFLSPAPADATVRSDPPACDHTYTRAHFHTAARSTFRTAFPPERKKRTLARIIRCQRRAVSVPIVRKHRKLYRAAWVKRFHWEHAWARVPGWLRSTLVAISGCESGGNPVAISPSGQYRGLLQFDYGTWASVGGSGDPAAASKLEQLVRGATLYSQRGSAPWPVCGGGR